MQDPAPGVSNHERATRFPGSGVVHGPDLVVTAVILAGVGGLYFLTTRFDSVSMLLAQNIPPEFFPRLLLWSIAALALLLPFEHRFHKRGKAHLDGERRHKIEPIALATAGTLCLVVALMPWLGTFLAMVLTCAALPVLWGERRLRIVLPFALLFPGAVTLLFTQALKVYFEPGILAALLP